MAKKSKSGRAATAALEILNTTGTNYRLIEYEHSDEMKHGFALDTVAVLGLDPDTVFKTLMVEADGSPVVAIVPASHKLNLKSLAKAVGAKHAEMMVPARAQRISGYIKGGISPLGQRSSFPTVIDYSAVMLPEMLVSGGKRSLSVALAPADLAELTGASFAEIATR
ncbi:MAG: Cys-tRNA(Pro) deacylase [Varibaculum sp.]|nr:Cys-tRNA(Pro) deacylase [Varibaculum sp.]